MSPEPLCNNNDELRACESTATCPSPIRKESKIDELLKVWSNEEEDKNAFKSNTSWRYLGNENLLVMDDLDNPWEQDASELIEMESFCDEVLMLPSLDELDDNETWPVAESTETDSEPTEVPNLFNVSPLTSQDDNIVANQNIEGSFENKTLTKVDDSVQEHDNKSDKRNNCDNDNELNIDESD